MTSRRLIFRKHALNRMFERGISETDVNRVLVGGEIIQTYPDDTPYPSHLMLGISSQVTGGTHITFEMVTRQGKTFYMTRWPRGLPGHDDPPNVLRFPHGLIRVGESLEKCASRLVREQLGMSVRRVRIAYWDSYLDEFHHWHVEPGCIVDVAGRPRVPHGASEIVTFSLRHPGDDLLEA